MFETFCLEFIFSVSNVFKYIQTYITILQLKSKDGLRGKSLNAAS